MKFLKTYAPILLSPTFWGLTLSAFAKIVALNAWLDAPTMDITANWIMAVTGVNIVWKGAKKVSGK